MTGRIAEAEGVLVWLRGGVTGWGRSRWTLDDGSGPATVVLRASTGLRRPWLERGEVRAVAGLVARDGDEVFVLPRMAADLAPDRLGPPLLLPETGGERRVAGDQREGLELERRKCAMAARVRGALGAVRSHAMRLMAAPGSGERRIDFLWLVERLVRAIRDGADPSPGFQDGLRTQRVMDAITTSSHEERWIAVGSMTNKG